MITGYQRKRVVKKSDLTSLPLLEREYRPCRGGKLRAISSLLHSLLLMTEAFSGSLKVHMQPLQKIINHSKSPR